MPLQVNEVGVRECFTPRDGYVYVEADIAGLEGCTLAQCEIWTIRDHRKADKINAGIDLLSVTGAVIAGTDYESFFQAAKVREEKDAKHTRNLAKVAVYGKPGGMADETLVGYARTSYGIKLGATPTNPRPTRAQAEAAARYIGNAWRNASPEDVEYLAFIKTLRRSHGGYDVIIGHPSIGTCIRRGRATFCAASNSLFQGLGALAAGEITWEVQKACYATPASPLYGSRLVMFAYDAWLLETPLGRETEAAAELERVIRVFGAHKVPDVKLKAEAVAMNAWSKDAKRVTSKDGQIMIWGTPECEEVRRNNG